MRLKRESRTVETMIRMYCQGRHGGTEGLCVKCEALLSYAKLRLIKCPFQEKKTVCSKCPIHCYRPAVRTEIREVMRYAGPRMLAGHPTMALVHLIDGLRRRPKGWKKGAGRK
jgi:hypothetical protein